MPQGDPVSISGTGKLIVPVRNPVPPGGTHPQTFEGVKYEIRGTKRIIPPQPTSPTPSEDIYSLTLEGKLLNPPSVGTTAINVTCVLERKDGVKVCVEFFKFPEFRVVTDKSNYPAWTVAALDNHDSL